MLKNSFLWALMCLTAPSVCLARTDISPADSIDRVVLQEITVKATPVIRKADGNSYLPSAVKKQASTSGLDLLNRMQLPRISVNLLTGTVNLTGGGEVMLCINGVEATSAEITALRPDDIVRIELHDRPGVKYSGADAVIDYITRSRDRGGNLSAEGMNALGNGKWAMIDNVSARYNHGTSSLALTAGMFGLHRDNWIRDYEERWNYPDGTVTRREEGLPVSVGMMGVDVAMNYTLRRDGKYFLNLRASLTRNDVPDKEEGDRHTMLHTSASETVTEIYEHTQERDMVPSVGVRFRRNLGDSRWITAGLSGMMSRSKSHHVYTESVDGRPVTDVVSDASGRRYSISGEAYYEARCGASHFTAGLRHQQSRTTNDYSGMETARVILDRSHSEVFGEYDVRFSAWTLLANLKVERLYTKQGDVTAEKFAPAPSVSIGWEPVRDVRFGYDVSLARKHPPLSSMNDVEQTIQPGMVRRGNPGLKSFKVVDRRFTAGYFHRVVSADLALGYRREYRPVMTTTVYDGHRFVIGYDNQGSFSELRGELDLILRPWSEHLSVSLSPSLSRYFSHGNGYSHVRNIFHLGVNVDFNYGHWIFNGSVMTGAANSMYGEEIIREKDMNMLLAGYKGAKWSVQAGVFNAFMRKYWMKSENMSALTPYVSNAHCNKNAYAVVKFSVSLDFGSKGPDCDPGFPDVPLHDPNSGIMDGLK